MLRVSSEEWRPVAEYERFYEVSNFGRVRSVRGGRGTRIGLVMKASKGSTGYPTIVLRMPGKKPKGMMVHRLVAKTFLGQCPIGYEVNHEDGDKTNCCLNNLRYVTPSQNKQHAIAAGLWKPGRAIGERNFNARLTWDHVRAIRTLYTCGHTIGQIAKIFDISTVQVQNIVSQRSWVERYKTLSARDARSIRELISFGMKYQLIAASFGVSINTIRSIASRVRRGKVSDPDVAA